MPDAMKSGGVTGWQRIAALAQLHGVALSSHLWPELSAQLLCATPTAHWLEHVEWWNPILREPLEVRDGMAYASEQVGSGVEFDRRCCAKIPRMNAPQEITRLERAERQAQVVRALAGRAAGRTRCSGTAKTPRPTNATA